MILITVGTEKFPFDRLMNWLDRLISKGFLNPKKEEIVVQYGSCTILPSGVRGFSIIPSHQFQELVKKARLIIAHCGEGTIDLLSKINKPFILVPRSERLGEHVDNHQQELAEALKEKGINVAASIEDLEVFLSNPFLIPIEFSPAAYYAEASKMLELLFSLESSATNSNNLTNINLVANYV